MTERKETEPAAVGYGWWQPSEQEAEPVEKVRSAFQAIEIRRHPVYGHQLLIDGDLQISEADRSYNTAMVAPLVAAGALRNVAVLGGGDGGVLQEILATASRMDLPVERATMVDIDGEVIRLAQKYLPRLCRGAFDDPRSTVLVGDAFAFIEKARDLDGVVYDLTMEPVRKGQERTEFIAEILSQIAASLRRGGAFSMQCCGEGMGDPAQVSANRSLLEEIRACSRLFFTEVVEQQVLVPSFRELWTFLSARKP